MVARLSAVAVGLEGPAAPRAGATVVLLDPIERRRAAPWVGLDALRQARPRHDGYAALLGTLRAAGRADVAER